MIYLSFADLEGGLSLISELDEEFKKGNTIYPNDPLAAPLEITMIWALRHFYPCSDE